MSLLATRGEAWIRGPRHKRCHHPTPASCRLRREGKGESWVCSSFSGKVPRRLRLAARPPCPASPWPTRPSSRLPAGPGLVFREMPLEGVQKCSLWQLRHLTLLLSLWVGKGETEWAVRFSRGLQRVWDGARKAACRARALGLLPSSFCGSPTLCHSGCQGGTGIPPHLATVRPRVEDKCGQGRVSCTLMPSGPECMSVW